MSKDNFIALWSDQDSVVAISFLFPAICLLGIFLFYPIAYLLYLSFTTGSFTLEGIEWVGWHNYQRLFTDSDFWQVIGNTCYFAIFTIVPAVVLPLGLAILLNKSFAIQGPLRAAYFIPSITSLVAVGLAFRWLFQTDGVINDLLINLGLEPIPWLNSTRWAMFVLILLSIWKQVGFNLVVFLAGLQTISQSHYEAAELDGANAWTKFWYITLPGLKPTVIFAVLTTAIFTLKSFEQIYVTTAGGPLNSTNLLVYYIYEQAFARFEFGYASAAASILLVIAFVLICLYLWIWNTE